MTIYRLFTDTGQEVSAPNVSTHNRHQLSHQLSVVIASTGTTRYLPSPICLPSPSVVPAASLSENMGTTRYLPSPICMPSTLSSSRSLSTSVFSSRMSRALGSSLITALHMICFARSAYLQSNTTILTSW